MEELKKPCPYCKRPIPDSGVFGQPTYTDVPENHAKNCPIKEVMEVNGQQEREEKRKGKHPAVLMLESMLDGIPVEIDGRTYALTEDYKLCVKGIKFTSENPEGVEVWMNTWMEVPHFIKFAESMTDEERTGCIGNHVLNETVRK